LIGPYELHDFFLYNMLRHGFGPAKILYLFEHSELKDKYSIEEAKKWLTKFCSRFFSQQFKRSNLPDGPKIGSISLSQRGDWRMPTDAAVDEWINSIADY
jgi:NAD+ synthase (glutamine-hydrolysing)